MCSLHRAGAHVTASRCIAACRNLKGQSAADLVQHAAISGAPDEEETSRAAAAAISTALARRVAVTTASAASVSLQAAALREIQPAAPQSNRGTNKWRDGESAISTAALLTQARTPDDVAAIFRNMSVDHQRLRVHMWTGCSASDLSAMESLSLESKSCIEKVCWPPLWLWLDVELAIVVWMDAPFGSNTRTKSLAKHTHGSVPHADLHTVPLNVLRQHVLSRSTHLMVPARLWLESDGYRQQRAERVCRCKY
jgi:hypothetical protein